MSAAPIIIMSFNRPQFLEAVLRSLGAQTEAGLRGREVHLFQDGAVNRYSRIRYAADQDIEASVQVFRRYFPAGTVHRSPDNIGICENYLRAERYVFEERAFDHAYFLEDDMTLSPVYLEMLDRLHAWAEAAGNVAYFAAYGNYYATPEEIRSSDPHRLTTLDHNWGFGLIRRHWLELQPVLAGYYDIVLGTDYTRRPDAAIFALYDRSETAPRVSSQDAAKAIACDRLGLWRANTIVPYAKYIGTTGQHTTPELYRRVGYDRVVVSESLLAERSYPQAAEIAEKIAEQHQQYARFRQQDYDRIVAALPPPNYNPMRSCEPGDVTSAYRLFLGRDPDDLEVSRWVDARCTVHELVQQTAVRGLLRRFWAARVVRRRCTREDVTYAYRLCLHREPESEDLYTEHVGRTVAVMLARAVWDSDERQRLSASIEPAC